MLEQFNDTKIGHRFVIIYLIDEAPKDAETGRGMDKSGGGEKRITPPTAGDKKSVGILEDTIPR